MERELSILYRDDDIVIVDKPPDLLAVPGRGPERQDCVVSRARALFPEMLSQPAVHRLDLQTSGIMVLGMNSNAHRTLSIQFEKRQVVKGYIGVVDGYISRRSGTITLPFRLDPDNRPYQVYDPVNGKEAVTLWRRISRHCGTTRIDFRPLTGRTHQLRVHSAHPQGLAAPLVGDRLYGSGQEGETMLLHASFLSFNHPGDGRIVEFRSSPSF